MRGRWLLFAGVVILVAVAAGALSWLRRSPPVAAPPPSSALPPAPLAASEISLPCRIRAQHIIPVGAPVEGTIEFLGPGPGDDVYEGEVLGRIRNVGLEAAQQLAQAQVERAQARVDSLNSNYIAARLEASRARSDASRVQSDSDRAEKVYLRQQLLYREGATPRLVFEKAQQELKLAREQFQVLDELARQTEQRVDALRKELENARRLLEEQNREMDEAKENVAAAEIHSPVDGIMVARTRQAGDEVTREVKDLFHLAIELTSLEAVAEPEPHILERIRSGQEAVVVLAELAGQGIAGRVRHVKGSEVIVEFLSPNPAIRPGLSAQVRIKLR